MHWHGVQPATRVSIFTPHGALAGEGLTVHVFRRWECRLACSHVAARLLDPQPSLPYKVLRVGLSTWDSCRYD